MCASLVLKITHHFRRVRLCYEYVGFILMCIFRCTKKCLTIIKQSFCGPPAVALRTSCLKTQGLINNRLNVLWFSFLSGKIWWLSSSYLTVNWVSSGLGLLVGYNQHYAFFSVVKKPVATCSKRPKVRFELWATAVRTQPLYMERIFTISKSLSWHVTFFVLQKFYSIFRGIPIKQFKWLMDH